MSKIVKIDNEQVTFDDGFTLSSEHQSDCCEHHWLDFSGLELADVDKLDFDIYGTFFERVEDFGIKLIPTNGLPVPVPGYGSNNGYYSSDLYLVVMDADGCEVSSFDISDCQEISG